MEIKQKVSVIIGLIVAVMIVLTLIGATASTVDTAAAGMNESNRCSSVGCGWNWSAGECRTNATASLTACPTSGTDLPLATLFNTGGVVTLVFIAAGLLMALMLFMKMYKK